MDDRAEKFARAGMAFTITLFGAFFVAVAVMLAAALWSLGLFFNLKLLGAFVVLGLISSRVYRFLEGKTL